MCLPSATAISTYFFHVVLRTVTITYIINMLFKRYHFQNMSSGIGRSLSTHLGFCSVSMAFIFSHSLLHLLCSSSICLFLVPNHTKVFSTSELLEFPVPGMQSFQLFQWFMLEEWLRNGVALPVSHTITSLFRSPFE